MGEVLHSHEADVVACGAVLVARVTETNNETRGEGSRRHGV